jgi:hypothetical protein
MKVVEYLPLYGLIRNSERIITLNGLTVPVKDIFANYPELELKDYHIEQLDTFDRASLHTLLSQAFVNKKIIIAILHNLLATYIKRGGNTEHWVRQTFRSVNEYNVKLRSIIELYLVNLTHFVNSPSLIQSTVSPNPKPLNTSAPKVKEPTYNNLLEAFNSISEYNRIMKILHERGFCTINGTWRDYTSAWMAVQIKIIKCLVMQGYCKKTTFSPSEIQTICMNTFKTDKISRSTITHNHATVQDYSSIFKKIK